MTYELIVIWETGEKEICVYNSYEAAQKAADGYKIAFGRQISWTGINRK